MSKMHELLAVEGDLEGTCKKILTETAHTFSQKHDHFEGQVKTLKMFDSERSDEEAETERKEMVTTVGDKLTYTQSHVERYFDAVYQKDKTNQSASADIVIGGVTIAENVPATFLLGLESKLKAIRAVYESIPTLQDNVSWISDTNKGHGVYVTEFPEIRMKTESEIKVHVIYPHHFPKDGEKGESLPAQVEKIPEKKNIGTYELTRWSGCISSSEKSKLIGKVDELMRAVKKARQRANMTEVAKGNIGSKLFGFINS